MQESKLHCRLLLQCSCGDAVGPEQVKFDDSCHG